MICRYENGCAGASAAIDQTHGQLSEAVALLKGIEWNGSVCLDVEWYSPACPECGGVAPDMWTSSSVDRIRREGFTIGHKSDCKLAAFIDAGAA